MSLDLEKTFGGVPQEVNCFVFRQKGISEYLLNRVMSMHQICKTAISVEEILSGFFVKVGVHQEATLNQLLFVTAMHVLTKDVRD